MLQALRKSPGDVDWFCLSPAAEEFGSYNPGEPIGIYRVGGDVLLRDANGRSYISGADYALAFVDEIEQARHQPGTLHGRLLTPACGRRAGYPLSWCAPDHCPTMCA